MNGTELDKTELAYLLALVEASGVVGLTDPALFPVKTAEREATYGTGRKKLESNEWLKLAVDHTDEYDLDGILLEMVSIIADPENVVATVNRGNGKASQMVMHYLAEGIIVELSAPSAKSYSIGVIPDQKALQERVAEMLGVTGKRKAVGFSLEQDALDDIRALSNKGEQEEAKALLEATQLSGPAKNSFVAAMGKSEHGQIVVMRSEAGEIEAGRRSTLYGEDKTAWLVSRTSSDSTELEIRNGDVGGIGKLISERLKELSSGQEII
jgi:hypothetical protein